MICPCNRLTYVIAKCGDAVVIKHNEKDYDKLDRVFGIGSGDYVEFCYCMDCGKIQGNFPRPTIVTSGACPDCGSEERLEVDYNLTYKTYCGNCGLLFP